MRFTLTADVVGGVLFRARLKRLATRAGSMATVERELHKTLMNAVMYQYVHGGPAAGGWKPDAPATLARKARLGQDPRVMHATLALRKSLTNASDPNHVWKVDRSSLFLSTTIPYAGALAAGGRDPVIVSEAAKAKVVATLKASILSAMA